MESVGRYDQLVVSVKSKSWASPVRGVRNNMPSTLSHRVSRPFRLGPDREPGWPGALQVFDRPEVEHVLPRRYQPGFHHHVGEVDSLLYGRDCLSVVVGLYFYGAGVR